MRLEPLGDSAYIIRALDRPAFEFARALNERNPAGLIEAVPSYETVGIFVDPFRFDFNSLEDLPPALASTRHHTIPVCYEIGEDTSHVIAFLGISVQELADLHSEPTYACFAVGFCPGFAYLGDVHDRLAGIPRREVPRLLVPAGSVGITGRQTAVYPLDRPGGWMLIGKTPLTLVGDDYFPIQAGDTVRFTAIDEAEYDSRQGERL